MVTKDGMIKAPAFLSLGVLVLEQVPRDPKVRGVCKQIVGGGPLHPPRTKLDKAAL